MCFFWAPIRVFSACLPAVLRMTYTIENRSSQEFQVTSGFKRKHSEAELASQTTNPIILFTQDFRQHTYQISSEKDNFVASCVRHLSSFSPSGSLISPVFIFWDYFTTIAFFRRFFCGLLTVPFRLRAVIVAGSSA